MLKNINLQELGQVLGLMQSRKLKFLISLLAAVLSVSTFVIINSLTAKAMINGVTTGDQELMLQAVYLAVISLTLLGLVTPVTSYLSTRYGKGTMLEVRANLFSHIVELPQGYFHQHSSGEILSRMTNDLNQLESIYNGELYTVLESFAIGSMSVLMTFLLDWRLALVILVLGVATFSVNTLYARPIREISGQIQSFLGKTTQRFIDLVVGNRVLKLFNVDQLIVGKFATENDQLTAQQIQLTKKEAERDGVNYFLNGAYFVGVLGAGGLMVSLGWTDLGTVVAVLALRGGVEDLFEKFGSSLTNLQKSLAGVERVFELLAESEEELADQVYRYEGTGSEGGQSLGVVFDQVRFSYDGEKSVLEDLSLEVQPGQVVALVGYSGGGKSTLMKLLLGLYAPESGKVILQGAVAERRWKNGEVKEKIDVRSSVASGNGTGQTVSEERADASAQKMTLEEWRSQLAYVSQDAYLFDTTVEENIGYGRPSATQEEIIHAAKRANAHEFILSLPEGYQTKVGEKSSKLSGGQRQRIAIARALLKDAPILLLDEATSALDSESEKLVQGAITELMQGRTTIVIAHRLSTIQHADQIYVLDQGQVLDQGRHEELVARGGVYRQLCELQFDG